jgi:Nickel responsive protein SCO4226-like
MPRYVVERGFPNGFGIPSGAEGAQSWLSVVERNADAAVTWLHSYVSEDRQKSFCVYDGPSPEAIRKSAARSGLPVDRITQVRVLDPYSYPAPSNGREREGGE